MSTTATEAPEAAEHNGAESIRSAAAMTNLGDTVRASWKFSLDNIRSNIHHCSPEAKELLVWAFTWCIDAEHPLHFEEFAERVGYSANKFYKIYHGKDRHPQTGALMDLSAAMVEALKRFRRLELARAKMGRAKFVVTPTGKRIFTACDLARESQTPVMLYGGSHIGKTENFKQYCAENNHGSSHLVELEAVNGLRGVLMSWAEKIGVSPNANTPDLIARIKKAMTPNMVVILDEVHLLANTYRRGSFFACMEEIRRIWDARKFGLVMSYTLLGYEETEKHRKKELEQIFRRGIHRTNLGAMPTVGDIAAFAGAWGLEMPAPSDQITVRAGHTNLTEHPYKMLKQLAEECGVKAITERLRYGAKLADGDALNWEHVVKAHLIIQKNATAPATGWQN